MSDREDPSAKVDLHGLRPEEALRRLSQALHAARVRGVETLTAVTGRGWGNREQKPVLRAKVEAWLNGPEGRRAGVRSHRRTASGGALEVRLQNPGRPKA